MTGNPETPETAGPKRDLVAAFKQRPAAEKILALAAAALLLAFVIDNRWDRLFRFGSDWMLPWQHTLSFVGAVGVLVLVITNLMGVRLVDPKLHGKLLVLAAMLPAAGLLADALRDFWGFVMLACIVVMAYAGAKITAWKKILGT